MPYKIRTKLIIAFLGLIFVLLSVTGIVGYYNQTAARKTFQQVEEISKEVKITGDLQLVIERILMPANDYLITGNRKYIDDFDKDSKELEKLLSDAEAILIKMEKVTPEITAEERKILNDVKIAWQNIKALSNKIFAITNPVGNMEAARLMEEMDYKWGRPAADGIHRWHEGDYTEYEAAIYSAKNVWLRSWIIMGIGAFMLIFLGIAFALFYTGIFVRPITVIHNGADKIAHGDFKTRLDIKTGDEIEQLSNAMNEMAAQLDSMYSNMQAMVDERTLELKESETRFRSIIETAKDAVVCIEEAGVICQWNKSAEEMFGYSANEAIGKGIHSLIVPERLKEKAYTGFNEFSKTGTGTVVGKTIEIIGLKKGGTEFPVELSISAMNVKGKWHAVGIIRNITERKEAEKKLAEQMDFLKRFHKAAVQREFRIKELKDENKILKARIEEIEEELKKVKG